MRFIVLVIVAIVAVSCASDEEKEERLARQYCTTCHAHTEPALLDKESWRTVLPQMAVRMGLDISLLTRIDEADYPYVIQTLPQKPMISASDFEKIMNYYEREAPDSLTLPPDFEAKQIDQFDATPLRLLNQHPTITMLRADTVGKRIWLSNRKSMLYQFDYDFKLIDSMKVSSPASNMVVHGEEEIVSLLGIMDPNDQPKGSVIRVKKDRSIETLIDSIKRPVNLKAGDLNGDKLEDIVVCAFGNFGGDLSVYENTGDDKYIKHVISGLPGARKVLLRDFNNDGMLDILALFAQGDEQMVLYTNAGNFRFRLTTLFRVPPVWGSDFFDIVDFNKDGHWDIVYAHGDNMDFSIVMKPYHGVSVYINDGKNQFTESTFLQLYGALAAVARDFDKDGDVDIAAIAFFPDWKKTPERTFVYYENNQGKLEPYVTPLAAEGRWMLIEPVDIDNDGYLDILLGALDFDTGTPAELDKHWNENRIDIMLLKNLSRDIRDRRKK